MTTELTLENLQARLRANPALVLLEALPEKYYRDWHLPGARHLPHDEVRAGAGRVVPDKSAPIVVYCASDTCRNSHIAASELVRLGYTDVAVFTGGKKAWSEAGLPVEREATQPA
ncbi:MAG TPA: rhodanese-like domain-containing protein [Casimicrobiaceae bacterium]|nr:rhodanese-like domain-containing protein [Casimicrobiaceae bacterium]